MRVDENPLPLRIMVKPIMLSAEGGLKRLDQSLTTAIPKVVAPRNGKVCKLGTDAKVYAVKSRTRLKKT